ncbi:MAG TPA: 3-oxoacyl-[acyl-carrier-protein] synthase III C-terminal domain-containing protein [Candidatus Eisenbacteria bacterium]|nr:3-oxoacyl-[acyl-carrier-protein] synthase III C-terminal domain-containing protein [Candidatus Eisenbacteria bacterium]
MTAARLLSVATAVPEHVVGQDDAKALLASLIASDGSPRSADDESETDWGRLLAVFDHGGIATRRICMPIAWYSAEHTFGERNDLYIEQGLALAAQAVGRALERAGLSPSDIDHVVFVSSTGIATPSLDAALANRLGFRGDVRRTPIWGLGCAGGAAGLARAREFAIAAPGSRVLLVALELCSLAFQRRERSKRNLVAASLFADGAAAVVVTAAAAGASARGSAASGPGTTLTIDASASTLWPDTLDVMGWAIDGDGLHVVFSRDIPAIVRKWVRESVDRFLSAQGVTLAAIKHVVSHPGGMKVLDAYQEALSLPAAAFRHARDVLRERGNMSSPTCLFVLERFLASGDVAPGDRAILTALGPGFSAEYVLLKGVAA